MRTFAIDPGKAHLGYSAFKDGQLTHCGVSKLPAEAKVWPLGKVCEHHYASVLTLPTPDRVYVEQMRLVKARIPTGRSAVDTAVAIGNDLVTLTTIAAFIAGRMGGALTYVAHFACPKEQTKNRVFSRLSPPEMAILEAALRGVRKQDDIFDACAHGLRAVGRFG